MVICHISPIFDNWRRSRPSSSTKGQLWVTLPPFEVALAGSWASMIMNRRYKQIDKLSENTPTFCVNIVPLLRVRRKSPTLTARCCARDLTVCLNGRWFFDASSWPRSSRSFVVNGWSMVVTFFLSRVAVMPWYYYKCYSVWGSTEQRYLGVYISFYWIFTCVVLDYLNVYWFAKMVRGALKVTRSLKANGVAAPKEN